ncbi:MAG: PAS domain-containing protein [Ferrovibrio sp.]|uniref:PAS domain-containing protein n=1 Tax=Ferrovibrio sp. TaxID=1917215 RepID=UPI0026019A01|nr:PAS domain-containing protein [Ferrovibrio sp.]MCW0236682.1 PAS domain-containing protein [Ferrovibrio sp.]
MFRPTPTQIERSFGEDEIIVSKTDTKGRILYANEVFCRVGQYAEHELVGQPHSILRHPDMPRCVFQLLWDTIASGREIFAYVKNMAKSGDYYWVFAHVTPSYDKNGKIDGYHSNRRKPTAAAVQQIAPVYQLLLAEEQRHADRKQGQAAGVALLHKLLAERNQSYDEFVFSLAS